MDTANIIIISDVHIGTNLDTNWYNNQYHGPYLTRILQYTAEQAVTGQVQELIFLGDLFDQWMYTPDVPPPSVQKIVEANQNIFGPSADGNEEGAIFIGPLKAAIKAVVKNGGTVSYVHGNHDMMVTREEIAAISPDINFVDGWLYTPDHCEGQLLCTHGHLFSLFCAPDQEQYPLKLQPLPLGHFVSRLSALWCRQHGYTGWRTKNSGNPNGLIFDAEALAGIFEELLQKKDRLAEIAMAALLEAVGHGPDSHKPPLMITLRDGSTIDASTVGKLYDRLWKEYPASTGIGISLFGSLAAEFALIESDGRSSLKHFAEELWKTYTVVAMGHTHKPDDELGKFIVFKEDALYVNSGFACPAEQNVETKDKPEHKMPTFSEITVDRGRKQFSTSVYQSEKDADGNYHISLTEGPITVPFRQ